MIKSSLQVVPPAKPPRVMREDFPDDSPEDRPDTGADLEEQIENSLEEIADQISEAISAFTQIPPRPGVTGTKIEEAQSGLQNCLNLMIDKRAARFIEIQSAVANAGVFLAKAIEAHADEKKNRFDVVAALAKAGTSVLKGKELMEKMQTRQLTMFDEN